MPHWRGRGSLGLEHLVEIGSPSGQCAHDGTKITAVRDELAAFAHDALDLFDVSGGAAPGDAVLRGGGRDGVFGGGHLRVSPIHGASQAEGNIAGAEKEAIDAGRAGYGIDIGEGEGRFDLQNEERFGVGIFRVIRRAVEIEIIVEARSIQTALAEGREFDRSREGGGIFRRIDERDHEGSRAVLQEVVEVVGIAGPCANQTIDIRQVVQGDHALEFAAIPSVVLGVEPDGIEARLGGMGR